MFKKTVVLSLISVICLTLSGCGFTDRQKNVDEIKKDLVSTSSPKPTSSLPDKKGKTIGETIDDIGDGISSIAGDIGSSLGNAGSKLADELGTSLGEAGSKICESLEGEKDGDDSEPTPSPSPTDELLDRSVLDDVKDIVKDGIEYIKGDKETAGTEDIDESVLEGPYHVYKVSDGDTVKFKEWGKDVRVRLIGIDTPESVASEEYLEKSGKQNTQEGEDASSFLKAYFPKDSVDQNIVYIERDVEHKDRYGRELVYLYALKDGKLVFVNELLLREGLARQFTMQPNVKHVEQFGEAQKYARENGKGFWGTGYFEE